MEEQPPEEAWEAIVAKLQEKQDEKGRKRALIWIVLFSGVFFSSIFLSLNWIKNSEDKGAKQGFSEKSILFSGREGSGKISVKKEIQTLISGKTGTSKVKTAFINLKQKRGEIIIPASVGNQKLPAKEEENGMAQKSSFTKLYFSFSNILGTEKRNPGTITASLSPVSFDSVKVQSKKNRFLYGVTSACTNGWIVNSNFHEALNINSMSYLLPCYSFSGYFLMGYNLTEKKTLFLELGNNRFEQKYYTFNEGYSSFQQTSLNYIHSNLFMSFNTKEKQKNPNIRTSFSLLTGLNFGYLYSAKQTDDRETKHSIRNEYFKSNVGMLIGASYNVKYKKHFMISFGVRGNFGLKNIYAGSEYLPKELNNTYNESISLTAGLIYRP
ncbi:MAG TPA: hypothetical protein VNZ49_03970 [Bacteroidia bacterium]|nr:hypothetical protein [Bacteroidia bacterium]